MGKARSRADGDYKTDNAVVDFGADGDVTLTHDPDDGLILKSKATADDNPVLLTLQTGETDLAANDVIGKIAFQAPDEGTGTDAILVSGAIQAVAEGDHSSSSNATSLQFMTGASEAAATKMSLTSAGDVNILTDGAAIKLGADSDVTLTHVADTGLSLNTKLGVGGATAGSQPNEAEDIIIGTTSSTDNGLSIVTANNSVGRFYFADATSGSAAYAGYMVYDHSANAMQIGTNSATRLKIDSGGDIDVETGDIFFSTAGKGINLGVTSNTDSNTLDDYEEGTWTPVISSSGGSGVVTTHQAGRYTKVGRDVRVAFQCVLNTKGSGSGYVRITGLPYTTGTGFTHYGFAFGYFSGTNDEQRGGWASADTTEIRFNNGANMDSQVQLSALTNGYYLSGSFFFHTDS